MINKVHTIYCFSNTPNGGEGPAYAIGDDGVILGVHWCENESYVPRDLGVIEGKRPDRHEKYKRHFPSGYQMEFVPTSQISKHKGLRKALRKSLNYYVGIMEDNFGSTFCR